MKVVKKNVYYCDFCKKRGLRSLEIHEEHCTANPNRTCRLCAEHPSNINLPELVDKYKKYFELVETRDDLEVKYLKDFTLEDVRAELGGPCPACLLAIIRLVGLNRYYFKEKFKFDYQKELGRWWADSKSEDSR